MNKPFLSKLELKEKKLKEKIKNKGKPFPKSNKIATRPISQK